ncbi:MAG: universal stress protein [Bacteroidetes bacterium]|nr:universal stress protein [Bacteroidota bacterium]
MKHFTKILCPFDFSEFSEEAIKYAIKLADPTTEITLFNVVQLPYIMDPNGLAYYDVKEEEVMKSAEEALNKKIEALKASCPDNIFSKDYAVSNDPAEAILDKQSKGAYELVVMGSHGRKGFGRILMGSVSESVLREANCPVLIIKKVAEKK